MRLQTHLPGGVGRRPPVQTHNFQAGPEQQLVHDAGP